MCVIYHFQFLQNQKYNNKCGKGGVDKSQKKKMHDDVIKWNHFSALVALCAVTGEFPSQRPVIRSFDVFFDMCVSNKRLSKQS